MAFCSRPSSQPQDLAWVPPFKKVLCWMSLSSPIPVPVFTFLFTPAALLFPEQLEAEEDTAAPSPFLSSPSHPIQLNQGPATDFKGKASPGQQHLIGDLMGICSLPPAI